MSCIVLRPVTHPKSPRRVTLGVQVECKLHKMHPLVLSFLTAHLSPPGHSVAFKILEHKILELSVLMVCQQWCSLCSGCPHALPTCALLGPYAPSVCRRVLPGVTFGFIHVHDEQNKPILDQIPPHKVRPPAPRLLAAFCSSSSSSSVQCPCVCVCGCMRVSL